MAIDFTKFEKPELIVALNIFNEMNLLPSMESTLIQQMNGSYFNRLSDERNKLVNEINQLLDKKRRNSKEQNQINRLVKRIDIKKKAREKALNILLELGMVTKENYKELTLIGK